MSLSVSVLQYRFLIMNRLVFDVVQINDRNAVIDLQFKYRFMYKIIYLGFGNLLFIILKLKVGSHLF